MAGTSPAMTEEIEKNTGEVRSPVSKLLAGFTPAIFSVASSSAS
jgi:hypothetical protein